MINTGGTIVKNCKVVAMLLAGGQGSRLRDLTKDIAKPAVPYGGKYRIIDFALSNVANSGIGDIGILTQYKPHVLNDHIGIGSSWDLDRNNGGLRILAPFANEFEGRWYKGTANAIYENMNYIEGIDPEYVLILSGDHIYKMDYSKLIDFHIEKQADASISVIEVPWEEASRFGIMNIEEGNRINEFDEKPEVPKNNLASMGIYVFNWKVLKEYLLKDIEDPNSSNDFGKDIIPKMLFDDKKLFAYIFEGYWKDVGTLRSYWQANMDLLKCGNELDIYDRKWRIHTRNKHLPPQYIAPSGIVKRTMVNEGCVIAGSLNNCVLSSNIHVEENAYIENCVVLSKVTIKPGARVYNAIIMEDVVIQENMVIGSLDGDVITLVTKEHIITE